MHAAELVNDVLLIAASGIANIIVSCVLCHLLSLVKQFVPCQSKLSLLSLVESGFYSYSRRVQLVSVKKTERQRQKLTALTVSVPQLLIVTKMSTKAFNATLV